MSNTISPTSSVATSGMTAPTVSTNSSTAELLSSFKDILSSMMTMGGGSALGQADGSGLGDMMTPLMMLLLMEKLVDSGILSAGQSSNVDASTNQAPQNEPSGRPVGGVITQEFHPGHNGIDFGVVVGTPIKATMDGNVTYAGWNNQGYGNLVIVENGSYKTYYAHLSSIPVSVGDTISAGAVVGLSGNTGNSTGPHLHYEVRKNNVVIDPTSFTLGA